MFPLFLLHAFPVIGQTDIDAARRLITMADSVILISHVTTKENHGKRDVTEAGTGDSIKPLVFPSFFTGQDINSAVIVQRLFLPKQDAVALANIIRKPVKPSQFGASPLCFEPHHAILIYSRGHLSYIDLCFHCNGLVTSSDLKLSNMAFKDGKWKDMKAFFLKHGLTYEMENE